MAAVLNHPAWRLLTAALAAGKSQDNLSQELISPVPIPKLAANEMEIAADRYRQTLAKIAALYEGESAFASVCDGVLHKSLGLAAPLVPDSRVQLVRVAMEDVATTRGLRCDNRWHSPANRAIRSMLDKVCVTRLSSAMRGLPLKGRQPTWVAEEEVDEDTLYAVATATIQAGTIAWDRAKPTTGRSVERFPVKFGDLLVAMDGDGSLGKAAVYEGAADGTVDSHVARCRIAGGVPVADAVSCWLNSTWGRVQTTSLMTGSTGQTQLSPTDLLDVVLPTQLIERAEAVSAAYRAALTGFEPVTRRARRLICEDSSALTEQLLRHGAIKKDAKVDGFLNAEELLLKLELLYPSVRV
ncbi:hypothetical protein K7640_19325 [Micromonospora sp. PLK6-60]|uniref:hypothetical protein n=1 Tax=Micromonospora sp. PLK6-60 TaxID=2873383 RepID=UPI001CA6DA80|nr:hypothetical protein [Micromonospora sp. PLK6-60]MBY8873982.1 hypothetical protein [Micromonospora sp. PLK6-60]